MKKTLYIQLLISLIVCSGISTTVYSGNISHKVIETKNLALEGNRSDKTRKPILLLISREECAYCVQIKNEILEPMIISGDYNDRLIIRELMLDPFTKVRGFDGSMIDASYIATSYKIKVTPTLLFLGPDGKELAERMVGINTLELFSFYVDQAIDQATTKLNAKK